MTEEFIDEPRTGATKNPEIDSIWLTRSSVKPAILAVASMCTLIGLWAWRPLMFAGLVVVLVVTLAWVGESRSDSDELPLS
jgi:hypothetical protein